MRYTKCEFAQVGDTVGVTTGAGYYEFVVTRIDRAKQTAHPEVLCDWYLGEYTEQYATYKGKAEYHNANMLKQLQPRIIKRGDVEAVAEAPQSEQEPVSEKPDYLAIINNIARVEARKISNGYKVVAIEANGTEHVVKKSGALRCTAHFHTGCVNGNARENDLAARTQCAKTARCAGSEIYVRSLPITVAA